MGNTNSLESKSISTTGKSRRNSRVKEKYFSRFSHKKSKDNIFRSNLDGSENIIVAGGSGEPHMLRNEINDKEKSDGIEISSTADYDWDKNLSSYQHHKMNVRREGSADTDTARDALLLDETPSPCRGIEKNNIDENLHIKNIIHDDENNKSAEIITNDIIIYKIKSKNGKFINEQQQFNIDSKNNSEFIQDLFKICNKKRNLSKQDLLQQSTTSSSSSNVIIKNDNMNNDDMSLTLNMIVKELKSPTTKSTSYNSIKSDIENVVNIAAAEDHLTTTNDINVNEVEQQQTMNNKKKKNGNNSANSRETIIYQSSNNLKLNECGGSKTATEPVNDLTLKENDDENYNNNNNKKIQLNAKLFNKYLTNKFESLNNNNNNNNTSGGSSGSNIVIVQTESWNLIKNLQQTNSINRQSNTGENSDHLDTCEVIILKDSSSSSDSIFTDPLTPHGFTTELNECYISEENICDDDNNQSIAYKYLKSDKFNLLTSNQLLNEKLKKLSLSKVLFFNIGNCSNGDNNDSPEQDDLEMAIHLRNKLAQMLSSEDQKNCNNNNNNGGASGENGTIFNVSKAKKVELQNLSSRLPDNNLTSGQSTTKTSPIEPISTEFENTNQQTMLTTSGSSFFGSLTESNVLKKVATFITAEKSGNNGKLNDNQLGAKRPSLIPEKLDFGTYEKFEGQMLMKWFITSFQNSGSTLNEQELNALTQQYCTNLLTIGVIKQISEKTELENFNPFQMYQWTHRESPSTSVPISPGRLVADIKWPHSSKPITKISPNKLTKSTQSDIIRNKVETENYIENLTNEYYHQNSNTSPTKLKKDIKQNCSGDRKVYEIKKSLLNCNTLLELYEVIETLLPDRKPSTRLDQSTYYDGDLNETELTIYKLENLDSDDGKIIESVDIALQTSLNESEFCSKCLNLRNYKTTATSPIKEMKISEAEFKEIKDESTSKTSIVSSSSPNSSTCTIRSNTSAPPPPPPPPPPLSIFPEFQPNSTNTDNKISPAIATNIKSATGSPPASKKKLSNAKTPSPTLISKNAPPPPPPIPPPIPSNIPLCPPPPPPMCPGPPPPPFPSSSNIISPPPPPPIQNSANNSINQKNTNSSGPPTPLPMPIPDGLWFQTNTLRKNAVNPPKPMKPLYWTRIVAPKPIITEEKVDSSPEEELQQQQQPTNTEINLKPNELWQEIEETNLDNIDEFTDLFSRQAIIPKNKPEKKKINQIKTIKILDSKRSQNVGIFSRSLHFDFDEIEHAVYHCDTSIVNLETLQHIMSIKATTEELLLIRDASMGDIPLDAPEQFLLRIAQISSSAERISCIVFQAEFDEGSIQVSRKLEVVKHLSLFLTDSDDLKLLFSIILTLGNYMNGGNRSRGQADGFGLEILSKLKDVKSKDSKITLLHFIVKTYIDRKRKLGTPLHEVMLPIPDASDVDKACAVDFDEVKQQISELNRKLKACKITTENVVSLSTEENIQPFKDKMEEFIEMGTRKIERQFNKLDDCRTIFLKTMRFYHFIPKSGTLDQCTPGQFYEYWLHFTNDFKDIWKKEITFLSNELIKKMKHQHKIKKTGSTTTTTTTDNNNKPNKVKPGSLKDRILKMGKK